MSDGDNVHGRQTGERAPLALNEPEVCKPESKGGRLDSVWPIDLGEQVVGSRHEFEIAPPRNLSQIAAVGTASLTGASDISVQWSSPAMIPAVATGPLKLTFAPTSEGVRKATLMLVVHWTDGHVETRSVQVTARARTLDAAPHGAASPTATRKGEHLRVDGPKAPDVPMTADATAQWMNVSGSHHALMSEQKEGVSVIEKEAQKFKAPPAERTLWQELAELAFNIGTSGLASIVSKYISARITKIFVSSDPATRAAEAGKRAIDAAEQRRSEPFYGGPDEIEAHQRVVIAKRVGNYAGEDAAKHTKAIETEVSTQLGAAVSRSLTTAATVARGPQPVGDKKGGGDNAEPESTTSDDLEIAFFSDQRSMITRAETEARKSLNSLLAEHTKRQPDYAKELMEGVSTGLDEAALEAKEKQAAATAQQFMAYMARVKVGTEDVKAGGKTKTVTDMGPQREYENLEAPSLAAGVLEIVVDHDPTSGSISVGGARVNDISRLIANRLRAVPLAGSGVPLRLSLHHGATIITQDEAGRVRVGGSPLVLKGPHTEAQQIREAERILRIVLSKTLAQWGLDQIHTNDASPVPARAKAKQG